MTETCEARRIIEAVREEMRGNYIVRGFATMAQVGHWEGRLDAARAACERCEAIHTTKG